MSVEELKALYADMPEDDEDEEADGQSSDNEDGNEAEQEPEESDVENDEDEYVGEDEEDDETTLIEEEGKEPAMSYEEEMALLEKDKDMSVEELKALYANMPEDDEDEDVESASAMDIDDSASDASDLMSTRSSDAGDALQRLELADEAARSIHVDRPFLVSPNLYLREYQHSGLNWLVSLHDRRLNGILADEMGLGKTIQTIALIAYLAAFRGLWGPHLIVVPTSCLINWESEFKKFCPAFKILTYYGSAKARKLLRTGWSKLNSFHVCITSYQLVVQDAKAFRKKRWYYMILDEAHNIKVL
jgi:E1A-binding protein p400